MVRAKNNEIVSTFVCYTEKNAGLFFSGHGVHPGSQCWMLL